MTPTRTDVVVVGAGPVGLYAVFYLGLLEVACHVVDALPAPGGQCVELYADKPIYDVPGLPASSGRDLVERLLTQIAPFAAPIHLGQQVRRVAARNDGRFDVETTRGLVFDAGAIVVAGGVGAFQPRQLKVVGLERHRGAQVVEETPPDDDLRGRRIVVAGNGEPAVDTAIAACDAGAAEVVVVHRRDEFDVDGERRARFTALRDAGRVAVAVGQPDALRESDDGRLQALGLVTPDGGTRDVPLDLLVVRLGWSPRLGPIAEWGLALERKQIVVDTARFETSVAGIHAIGDVVTYPAKKKLIVCGFHEATLAAFAIAERLHPERVGPLQYTTTSAHLHRLLKVAPPSAP